MTVDRNATRPAFPPDGQAVTRHYWSTDRTRATVVRRPGKVSRQLAVSRAKSRHDRQPRRRSGTGRLWAATCAVRRAEATLLPQLGHETQHGAGCSTASGARWQMQSHASPGGGVGTNFVKARSRFGSPRMTQHTFGERRAEGELVRRASLVTSLHRIAAHEPVLQHRHQ